MDDLCKNLHKTLACSCLSQAARNLKPAERSFIESAASIGSIKIEGNWQCQFEIPAEAHELRHGLSKQLQEFGLHASTRKDGPCHEYKFHITGNSSFSLQEILAKIQKTTGQHSAATCYSSGITNLRPTSHLARALESNLDTSASSIKEWLPAGASRARDAGQSGVSTKRFRVDDREESSDNLKVKSNQTDTEESKKYSEGSMHEGEISGRAPFHSARRFPPNSSTTPFSLPQTMLRFDQHQSRQFSLVPDNMAHQEDRDASRFTGISQNVPRKLNLPVLAALLEEPCDPPETSFQGNAGNIAASSHSVSDERNCRPFQGSRGSPLSSPDYMAQVPALSHGAGQKSHRSDSRTKTAAKNSQSRICKMPERRNLVTETPNECEQALKGIMQGGSHTLSSLTISPTQFVTGGTSQHENPLQVGAHQGFHAQTLFTPAIPNWHDEESSEDINENACAHCNLKFRSQMELKFHNLEAHQDISEPN